VAPGHDPFGDGGNLLRRLPRPENHFREALAADAMVVDARESQILEWRLAQNLKELPLGFLRRDGAGADVAEQAGELGAGHVLERFDFAATPALT
jgi:hypothetical protein